MNILDKIFYGEIRPLDEFSFKKNKKYRENNKVICERMENLEKKLSQEDYEKLDKLLDVIHDSNDIMIKYCFNYGLKFAVSMMFEVFSNEWD